MTNIGKENRSSECLSNKEEYRRGRKKRKGGRGGGGVLSHAVGRTGRSFMGG